MDEDGFPKKLGVSCSSDLSASCIISVAVLILFQKI